MPEFVLLEHSQANQTHWDLMFAPAQSPKTHEAKLVTFKIPINPHLWTEKPVSCEKIADHRPIYLTYEGPLTGNRGHVRRIDHGSYDPIEISVYRWLVSVQGAILTGRILLDGRTTGQNSWTLNYREKRNILFLCTGNSCRSHMAQAWTRCLWPDHFSAFSAGTHPKGLDKLAIEVMAEAGIDISSHSSKTTDELPEKNFHTVITVCDHAKEACPTFSAAANITHVGFDDPPALAKTAKNPQEALDHYRRVRDQIKTFVQTLPKFLDEIG